MNRIKHISLFFRVLFQVLFIALPMLLIIAWIKSSGTLVMLDGAISFNYIPTVYSNSILHQFSGSEKLLALCLNSIPMIIQLYILFSLISLFKLYEKGEIFSINNVFCIRNIGYAMLITQVIAPIYEGLMGFVLTRYNPPGHRFISMTFDQTNIEIVLIGLMVILISWIMAEGCKLCEEQKLTV